MSESPCWQNFKKIGLVNASGVFPRGTVVKNLPANAGDAVRSLGCKDPLEKRMATHSSILAWRISWTEEPAGYSLWKHKEANTTERSHIHDASGRVRSFSVLRERERY